MLVGRSKGVERPPLAPLIPTTKGVSLLIDCGANVDARPSHLVQFAKMGSIYMENVVGIKNPRVAIVNNGAEEEKGNALVKETFPLLKECKSINFIGSIEARDIPAGYADVIRIQANRVRHTVKHWKDRLYRQKKNAVQEKPLFDVRSNVCIKYKS